MILYLQCFQLAKILNTHFCNTTPHAKKEGHLTMAFFFMSVIFYFIISAQSTTLPNLYLFTTTSTIDVSVMNLLFVVSTSLAPIIILKKPVELKTLLLSITDLSIFTS